MKTISLITPVLNEEANLPFFLEAVRKVLFCRKDYAWELIFVEDGSSDRSWEVIRQFHAEDPRVKGIRLSRNFGSHAGLYAGFSACSGDAAAFLPCDLQDPPEVILEFMNKWEAGAEIVFGHRKNRGDSFGKRVTSQVFNVLLRRFAMPRGSAFTTGSFLLADRKAIDGYLSYAEQNRITFALFAWTGFQQERVDYNRRQRERGRSGWNLGRMFKAFYDAFMGFSHLPVRLITIAAFVTFGFSLITFFYILFSWVLGNPAPGWTSIMGVLTLFFSIQFFIMTIVGEYLHRIYLEVLKRPVYLRRETLGEMQPR